MTLLRNRLLLVLSLLAGFAPGLAQAHKFWLLPSSTVLSGEGDWVTVDAARSNDPFIFNHNRMGLDGLQIRAPDGRTVAPENLQEMEIRSVFDVQINQPGSWKIAVVDDGLFARYERNGESHRWRGTAAAFKSEVPADADKLRVSERISRAEVFVTSGAPSREALEPTGRGLELVPQTHFNDLYAGETARFTLLLDGKPASGVDVEIIPGGGRYRDALNSMKLRSGDKGLIEITWPRAGMYYLEASVSDQQTSSEAASQRRLTYVATLEVLPL
ncbi:MAG: ABC transporter permease [Salinisphaeraceae bacterium]|nr:ABC transporter permease [Salinisphaeraceae bacterium]